MVNRSSRGDTDDVGSSLSELGAYAENSLRSVRKRFHLNVEATGGPVPWLKANAPELANVPESIPESDFFSHFEEDYVDGSLRLSQCAACPATGGLCAGGYRPGQYPQWHETKLEWNDCGKRWNNYQLSQLTIKCGVPPARATSVPGPGWDLDAIGSWVRSASAKKGEPWLVLKSNDVSSLAGACASIARRICHYWGPGTKYPPAWHRSVPTLEVKLAAQIDAGFDPFDNDDVLNCGIVILLDWEPDMSRTVQRSLDRMLYKRYSNGTPYAVIATTSDVKLVRSRFRQCSEFSDSSVVVVRSREL